MYCFHEDFSHENLTTVILCLPLVVSLWARNMHSVLVNCQSVADAQDNCIDLSRLFSMDVKHQLKQKGKMSPEFLIMIFSFSKTFISMGSDHPLIDFQTYAMSLQKWMGFFLYFMLWFY